MKKQMLQKLYTPCNWSNLNKYQNDKVVEHFFWFAYMSIIKLENDP